jgi:hypothetical protein
MSFLSNHRPEVLDEMNGRGPDCGCAAEAGRRPPYVPTAEDLAENARYLATAGLDFGGLDRLAASMEKIAADCRGKRKPGDYSWCDGMEAGMAAAFELAARWLRAELTKIVS